MAEMANGGWLIGPTGRCTSMVAEALVTAGYLHRAAIAAAHQGALLDVARSVLQANGAPTAAIDALRVQQAHLQRSLIEITSDPFGPIDRQAVIMMWVAVEVCVEDTARAIIEHDPSTAHRLRLEGHLRGKAARVQSDATDVGVVYQSLERSAKDAASPGRVAEQYCKLLARLDLHLDLKPPTADLLAELNYVRNCLLHRGGIADERARRDAPSLCAEPGERLLVSRERVLAYSEAASDFATALLSAAVASRYVGAKS